MKSRTVAGLVVGLVALAMVQTAASAGPGGDALAAEVARELVVTGRNGVPLDAAAVALNVTAVSAGGPGYATAYPCGEARPEASNLNFVVDDTVPNTVIVRPGVGGKVCFVASADADLLVDVSGWFDASSAAFWLAAPVRVLSTRDGIGTARAKVVAGTTLRLPLATAPVGSTGAVLNVTVTNPEGSGFLTVFPCGGSVPVVSNLNFQTGATVANLAVVKPGDGNGVCFSASATTDVIADLSGWLTSGYSALAQPVRIMSTRDSIGVGQAKLQAGSTLRLDLPSAPPGSVAAVLNVTVTNSEGAGYLTVFPCGASVPEVSNLNFSAEETVANLAITKPGDGNDVCFFASATTDVLADLSGWLTGGYQPLAQPTRVLDTRRCPYLVYSLTSNGSAGAEARILNLETGLDRELFSYDPTKTSSPYLAGDCRVYVRVVDGPLFVGTSATFVQRFTAYDARGGSGRSFGENYAAVSSLIGQKDGGSQILLLMPVGSGSGVFTLTSGSLRPVTTFPAGAQVVTSLDGRYLYSSSANGVPEGSRRLLEFDTVTGQTRVVVAQTAASGVLKIDPGGGQLLLDDGTSRVAVDVQTGATTTVGADAAVVGWTRDGRIAQVPRANRSVITATTTAGATETLLTVPSTRIIVGFSFGR